MSVQARAIACANADLPTPHEPVRSSNLTGSRAFVLAGTCSGPHPVRHAVRSSPSATLLHGGHHDGQQLPKRAICPAREENARLVLVAKLTGASSGASRTWLLHRS